MVRLTDHLDMTIAVFLSGESNNRIKTITIDTIILTLAKGIGFNCIKGRMILKLPHLKSGIYFGMLYSFLIIFVIILTSGANFRLHILQPWY